MTIWLNVQVFKIETDLVSFTHKHILVAKNLFPTCLKFLSIVVCYVSA